MSSEDAMSIIEEYLEEVRRYLPEDIADDVIAELRTHIIDKAEDMGGLTPENVLTILHNLGPPRKLASKYVVGRGRRKFRMELGIPEDLYPYFTITLAVLVIAIIIGAISSIIQSVASGGEVAISTLVSEVAYTAVSIVIVAIFLYIAFSLIGSSPELAEKVKAVFRDIMESFGLRKTKKKVEPKPKRIKYKRASPWPDAFSATLSVIIAYIAYRINTLFDFNWLMSLLIYTIIIYFAANTVLRVSSFFYVLYSGARNYIIDFVRSLMGIIFIPWLFVANMYPEELQILVPQMQYVTQDDSQTVIIKSWELMTIPNDYLLLAKLVLLIWLIMAVVGIIIVILRYVRTRPKD